MKDHPETIWYAWLVILFGSLAGIEAYALKTERIPPLSGVLRLLLGLHPRRRWGHLALIGLSCVWTWLTIHLVADVAASISTED
jgi:hypothetical protein